MSTVTIKDVAKLAGVSIGTVSNMLTQKRPVAEETRQRILAAIESLGYTPNLLARGLINRQSYSLGVITTNLELYGTSSTLVGIEKKANELGYSLILQLLHEPEYMNPAALISGFQSRQVDGIIWAVPEIDHNMDWVEEYTKDSDLPILFIFVRPRQQAHMVHTRHRQGSFEAVEHLINNGCQKIAMISGPFTWWLSGERLQGYEDALERAGIPYNEDLVKFGDWSAESGETAAKILLEQHPDLDGLFASNDQMALGAIGALHRLDKKIPLEVAVIGYNNIPESQYFWPSLSTVNPHHQQLGSSAVEKIIHIITKTDSAPEAEEMPNDEIAPELVIRESSKKS